MKLIVCVLIILCSNCYVLPLFVPKLLLPYYDQVQVNYTIHADEGCFKWRSQNPDVASIEPIPKDAKGCTTAAIVFVQSRSPSRRITLVFAENELTGTILQCDVIIDQITSIDIISRTRELYLDDPPEELSIRALDEEGNTFSSTAYMIFSWKLLPDEVDSLTAPHKILHITKFVETEYKAEAYVEKLERRGLQSDTILIEGLQTGSAYVQAKMRNGMEIMTAKVNIIVRDKVFLVPNGDVFIPVHGIIKYRVEKWRYGRPTEVILPHHQYSLELGSNEEDLDSEPAVSLDTSTSTVIGLKLGSMQLYLMDSNLRKDTVQDSSKIFVVEPAYIRFSIQPDDRWVLETGRDYIIIILMFDVNDQRIYPTSNIRINVNFDAQFFNVRESSGNGSWHSVRTLQKGITELYAILSGVMGQSGSLETYSPAIDASQIAEIYDPIEVHPPKVAFPWTPKPVQYKYKLHATGGSGNYTWSIDDDSFAIVTTNGIVMTKAGLDQDSRDDVASAEVRATDVRNSDHWGTAQVMLAPVEEIFFARSHREAEIGEYLDLYITMHAIFRDELIPVGDCRESGLLWKVQDPSMFESVKGYQVEIPEIPGTVACAGRRLRALREGYTVLMVRYEQCLPNGKEETLEASVTIVAFPPLIAIDPVSLAVVSLDSTKTMRFKGGPPRWPLWHSGHERVASASNNSVVELSIPPQTPQEHLVIAWCGNLGQSVVTLRVFNKPCNTNPMPVEASVCVRVSCAIPHHLELRVAPLPSLCPLNSVGVVQTVAVLNNAFLVNLTLYDDYGHLFDNFTSVYAKWSTNDPGITCDSDESFFVPFDSTEQKKHVVQKRVNVAQTEGEHIITVSMTKYKHNNLGLDPFVTGTVGVLVVSPPVVMPDQIVLYNHVNFTAEVKVIGGSGHFCYELEQQANVSKVLQSENAQLQLGPLRAGVALLKVTDLCLIDVAVVTAEVKVVEVSRLVLKAPPRLELGDTVTVTVEMEDNFGQQIPVEFLTFMNFEITSSVKEILTISSIRSIAEDMLTVESSITGAAVGATMLSAVVKLREGYVVKSNAIYIVVISPLELYPPVVTLIRHAEFQLRTVGGPRSDFTMKFLVEDDAPEGIVNVSQSGVVHALRRGATWVTAQAIMHDGQIFYCKSPSEIRVVQLAGIRIDSPLTQYHVGGTIPLHVNGLNDDQSPMSFGGTVPGLIFKWDSGNPSVVKLHTVHAKAGIETSDRLSFTMLAEGMSAGHCVVTVRVFSENKFADQLSEPEFRAEISLMVYDPLAIISTESCVIKQWKSTSNFLITPSTSHHLQTNRDGAAKRVVYEVLSPQKCTPEVYYSSERSDNCITVTDRGVIESGPNQCQSTLLITAVERFGINQTMALAVLVRPVSYVIARAVTQFRTRENDPISNAFPLFATVQFAVDQFDDAADKFDATSQDVMLDLNRYDRVEIEPEAGNRSFNLRLPLEGTTIMSVASYMTSTTTPSAVYYFPISVQSAIQPEEQILTIGLNEFLNINGSAGNWYTMPHNPKFLVDSKTGAVVAVGKGEAKVSYKVDNLEANADVFTEKFVASLDDGGLTGPVSSKVDAYVLPIKMSPGYKDFEPLKCTGLDDEMSQLARQLFTCSVSFANSNIEGIYSAEPGYIPETDSYACVISHRDLNDTDYKLLATVEDELVVTLGIQSLQFGSVANCETSLSFLPGFVVHMSSTTLVVGSFVNLCIFTTPQIHESIKIIPCDPKDLDIKPDPLLDQSQGYCYRVATYSKDVSVRNAYVRVISHLTEQEERIDLMIDRVPGRLVSTPSQCSSVDRTMWRGASDMMTDSYLAYLTTFAVILISTALLIAAFTAYRWVSNNSTRPEQSFNQSPPPYDPGSGTPLRAPGSPGSTPKPRLWSRYYQPQQASPNSG